MTETPNISSRKLSEDTELLESAIISKITRRETMLTLLSMEPSTKACLINSITVELLESSMLILDQLVLLLRNKSSKENLRRKSMLELNISDTLILDLLSYKESKKMTRRKLKLKNKA